MRIILTKHAVYKLKKFNILRLWVEETIKSPDTTKRQFHKYIVRKKLNGKTLEVVYEKEKFIKVITNYYIK